LTERRGTFFPRIPNCGAAYGLVSKRSGLDCFKLTRSEMYILDR
jgi:hypothetical protein